MFQRKVCVCGWRGEGGQRLFELQNWCFGASLIEWRAGFSNLVTLLSKRTVPCYEPCAGHAGWPTPRGEDPRRCARAPDKDPLQLAGCFFASHCMLRLMHQLSSHGQPTCMTTCRQGQRRCGGAREWGGWSGRAVPVTRAVAIALTWAITDDGQEAYFSKQLCTLQTCFGSNPCSKASMFCYWYFLLMLPSQVNEISNTDLSLF